MSINLAHVRYRQQFDILHKGTSIAIGNYFIYADGAMMERPDYGLTYDPPPDPYQLALVQVRYYEELHRRAVEEFSELKESLHRGVTASQRENLPPPPSSELERLRQLKRLVRKYQSLLNNYRERAEASMPESKRLSREADGVIRELTASFASQLGTIKL